MTCCFIALLGWCMNAEGQSVSSQSKGRTTNAKYSWEIDNYCADMCEDQDNLWIATSLGLVQMNKVTGEKKTWTTSDGLPDNDLLSVAKDTKNNLWIGTMYNGVAKWDGQKWTYYTQDNSGLFTNQWNTRIAFGPDGKTWIGTLLKVESFDGETWASYTSPKWQGAEYWFVYCFKFDSKGQLWIGGTAPDWSLATLTDGSFKILDNGVAVTAMDEAADGTMWLARDGALYIWKDGALVKQDTGNSLTGGIRDIKFDSKGVLWIASGENLVKMENGELTVMATCEKNISRVLPESDGSVWVGSYGGDIFRYVPESTKMAKWLTGISGASTGMEQAQKVEYFDLSGKQMSCKVRGLEIEKKTFKNGRCIGKKIWVK
jgi:ligand-binding sensor domain-containing protein